VAVRPYLGSLEGLDVDLKFAAATACHDGLGKDSMVTRIGPGRTRGWIGLNDDDDGLCGQTIVFMK